MQGLGGLLCLATVAIEALLSVMAAALSGFGLFFRVSFRWGHDDLLRIVMSSIPTYMNVAQAGKLWRGRSHGIARKQQIGLRWSLEMRFEVCDALAAAL